MQAVYVVFLLTLGSYHFPDPHITQRFEGACCMCPKGQIHTDVFHPLGIPLLLWYSTDSNPSTLFIALHYSNVT